MKLLSIIVWLNFLLIFSVFATVMFYLFCPTSFWGEYEYIRFIDKRTEGLVFVSKNVIYRQGDFHYQDILKCDDKYFSEYSSGVVHLQARDWTETEWIYQARYPETGLCYLDSTSCVQLPFGIQRCTNNKSEEFVL